MKKIIILCCLLLLFIVIGGLNIYSYEKGQNTIDGWYTGADFITVENTEDIYLYCDNGTIYYSKDKNIDSAIKGTYKIKDNPDFFIEKGNKRINFGKKDEELQIILNDINYSAVHSKGLIEILVDDGDIYYYYKDNN